MNTESKMLGDLSKFIYLINEDNNKQNNFFILNKQNKIFNQITQLKFKAYFIPYVNYIYMTNYNAEIVEEYSLWVYQIKVGKVE